MKRRDVDTESYKGTVWFNILGRYGIVTRIEAAIYAFLRVPSIAVYELCDEYRDSARHLQHELLELREATRQERLELGQLRGLVSPIVPGRVAIKDMDASAKIQELRAAMEAACQHTISENANSLGMSIVTFHIDDIGRVIVDDVHPAPEPTVEQGENDTPATHTDTAEIHLTPEQYAALFKRPDGARYLEKVSELNAEIERLTSNVHISVQNMLTDAQKEEVGYREEQDVGIVVTRLCAAWTKEIELNAAQCRDSHEALSGLVALNAKYNPRFYFDLTCFKDRSVVTQWKNGHGTEFSAPTPIEAVRAAQEAQE